MKKMWSFWLGCLVSFTSLFLFSVAEFQWLGCISSQTIWPWLIKSFQVFWQQFIFSCHIHEEQKMKCWSSVCFAFLCQLSFFFASDGIAHNYCTQLNITNSPEYTTLNTKIRRVTRENLTTSHKSVPFSKDCNCSMSGKPWVCIFRYGS